MILGGTEMSPEYIKDLIDEEYIATQLQRLKIGQLKKSSLESYASLSLRSSNGNLKDYLNYQIIKAIHRYNQVNGE